MSIERVYLGTWFQRTSLHLRELYSFLKHREGVNGLDRNQLDTLWQALQPEEIVFTDKDNFDFVEGRCGQVRFSVSEDGVLLFGAPAENYEAAVAELEHFYAERFSPAIQYLFSRGAPLPKELAKVKDIYPVRIIVKGVSQEGEKFFREIGDTFISSAVSSDLEILSGRQAVALNVRQGDFWDYPKLEELLRDIVFFREFDDQLSHYLNLHRGMWDEISRLRESRSMRYRDFPRLRGRIMQFLKTLSFVEARLNQMEDIIEARFKLLRPELSKTLSELGLNRFDHLIANRKYVEHLWQMTIEYVKGTLNLLESLFQENTQRELNALKFISLIGALTGFFGMNIAFPWEERWAETALSSWFVTAFIAALALGFYYVLRTLIYNRRFVVRESGQGTE